MRMVACTLILILGMTLNKEGVAADTKNGARLYAQYCQTCHGANGRGEVPGAPDFSRSGALLKTDAALFSSIKSGRKGMPGFLGILKDRDLFDVIAYLRTLG